ncbi:LOW QUALITY PROTEIN: eukaryotic peptide chain release factor subunit 1-like [Hippocampus zosterae]|uniref:LOW QUALITY PROTEIN: eukaryotic peptide chain release factor subunit 1-like n=1 Tax=Hippocampus zosterae TaxID=109293 RepID=UPI00223D43CD|nr:LOW QUALITY PROTEIN: eukaryotic peptide chain release factor subunit 1-like [Hippocampus zosterae]
MVKELIVKILRRVDAAKPTGSVVSIIMPPRKQISDVSKLLTEELGKSSCIKDRTTRNSVAEAQTSAIQRLKLYNKVPPNGLCLYTGLVMEDDNKGEKKIVIDFEPNRPINLNIYSCGLNFVTDEVKKELLANEPPFGFIIVDGNGALYGTLQGRAKEVINKFTVELPKKHARGGQSSVRFGRLRVEKRHNYLRKVCEVAESCFLVNDRVTVTGLVLAGSADFKNELEKTQMFDPRLAEKVVKVVDICYGGENGFNQAIELSQDALESVRFVKERKSISKFFDEIATDSGMVCYGVADTMKLIDAKSIARVLLFEGSADQICHTCACSCVTPTPMRLSYQYVTPEKIAETREFTDQDGSPLDLEGTEVFTEWITENYRGLGIELELVSDRSPEGTQFLKGFGGVCGFLRYKLEQELLLGGVEWTSDDEDFM